MDKTITARQCVRYQRTVVADEVTAVELPAHRIVGYDLDGDGKLTVQAEATSATFLTVGVNQFTLPAADSGEPSIGARDAAVATSGDLIVEIDIDNPPVLKTALEVDGQGRASSAAGVFAVTVNGTAPYCDEISGNHATYVFN